MARANDLLFLAGRTAVGGFLLQNAMNHFTNTKQMVGYAKSKGVQAPYLAVLGSGSLLAIGGINILTGRRPKAGIAAAALFFAGVTPRMHQFWKMEDEAEKMNEVINFSKNVAILGATLALTAVPEPWPISLRRKKGRGGAEEASRLEQAVEAGHS